MLLYNTPTCHTEIDLAVIQKLTWQLLVFNNMQYESTPTSVYFKFYLRSYNTSAYYANLNPCEYIYCVCL